MASRWRSCSTEGITLKSDIDPGNVATVTASRGVTGASNQDTISPSAQMATDPNEAPRVPLPDYRPIERFWPYVDLPEQPTDEELAALSPELSEALFGTPKLPFSVTLEFPVFDGPDYAKAIAMARASAEY